MLAYEVPGDLIDEYVRMSESTCLESLYKFCKAVIAVFGPECTVILEVVASQDLWICHSLFGMAGSHNDINMLQRSPMFARLAEGNSPPVNVTVNNHNYDK